MEIYTLYTPWIPYTLCTPWIPCTPCTLYTLYMLYQFYVSVCGAVGPTLAVVRKETKPYTGTHNYPLFRCNLLRKHDCEPFLRNSYIRGVFFVVPKLVKLFGENSFKALV